MQDQNPPHEVSPSTPAPKKRLSDHVRHILRTKHYALSTEESYINWMRRYINFHGKKHPAGLGETHIRQFLTHLAVNSHVSASTQNQALNALVFLYKPTFRTSDSRNFGILIS